MNIVIIGGIAAGMSTAAKARREDPSAVITVIEKEDYISFGACGLPYYLGNQFEDSNEMFARTPDQITQSGINLLMKHEVLTLNPQSKELNVLNLEKQEEFTLSYDRLMIATGATPIKPKLDNVDADNVYTITRLEYVDKLKTKLKDYQNIVVIGGGFIGVEVSEQLIRQDKSVTLLHSRDTLMNGVFDPEFGVKIQEALEEVSIRVKVNERVESLKAENNSVTEVCTSKACYPADAVIIATGFKPNTEFLREHFEVLDNGALLIDEYGRTSENDIFAAGDCASINHIQKGPSYIPLATYANKMGRLIGTNIVSEEKDFLKFNGALGSSSILVANYEAGRTGLTESEASALSLNFKTTLVEANNHSNYYPNQEKVMIKLVYDQDTFVLYGAQVFGKGEAVLRLQALTTAIYAGLTTKELGFMDFAYSPPFASTWEALNIAANTAK